MVDFSGSIFAQLCLIYNSQAERDGEVHVVCPFCAKPGSKSHVHFSFCIKGYKCFACGNSGSLQDLANFLGTIDLTQITPSIRKRERVYTWPKSGMVIAAKYSMAEGCLDAWQKYKLITGRMAQERLLGLGIFPRGSSRCRHTRLMVPLLSGGHVIGFRGRAIDCSCGKWLSPGGSKMVLYNGARLLHPLAREKHSAYLELGDTVSSAYARGKILVITENPIDAIMLENIVGVQAIATLGVGIWRDEWTGILVKARPRLTIVWFDHDQPGNGGGDIVEKNWLRTHNFLPEPNGKKLVRRLNDAGANAILYRWDNTDPIGKDPGDFLRELLNERRDDTGLKKMFRMWPR